MLSRAYNSSWRFWRPQQIFVLAPAYAAIRTNASWFWEHLPSFASLPNLLRFLDRKDLDIRLRRGLARWFNSINLAWWWALALVAIISLIRAVIPTIVLITWIIAPISVIVVSQIWVGTSLVRPTVIVSRSRRFDRGSGLRRSSFRGVLRWRCLGLEDIWLRRSRWRLRGARILQIEADLWTLRGLGSGCIGRWHALVVRRIWLRSATYCIRLRSAMVIETCFPFISSLLVRLYRTLDRFVLLRT
jgi:hypothetical protein